jgi:hypothetical protein
LDSRLITPKPVLIIQLLFGEREHKSIQTRLLLRFAVEVVDDVSLLENGNVLMVTWFL